MTDSSGFIGKRFNVLHQRTDSWHYEVDQLILGTLLFTLFTFSLPTLLTYGIVFALVCNSCVHYGRQTSKWIYSVHAPL
jgi:hypothetical protein